MGLFAYTIGGLPGSSWAAYELLRDDERREAERAQRAARNTPEYRAGAEAAQLRAHDCMGAGIRRAAIKLVKARARSYTAHPGQLEMVGFGLSGATASQLIEIGRQRIARTRGEGLSGADLVAPVEAANARACMVVGRYWRRFEQQLAKVA
jgi:hypothetical protein